MSVSTVRDLTGQATSHRISETLQIQFGTHWWLAPATRPFYVEDLVLHDPVLGRDLRPTEDYLILHSDDEWTVRTERPLAHFLVIVNSQVSPSLVFTANRLGGDPLEDAPTVNQVSEWLDGQTTFPQWGEQVIREKVDPVVDDLLKVTKRVTMHYVIAETEAIRQALLQGDVEHHDELMAYAENTRARYLERIMELMKVAQDAISAHIANPFAHNLTKDQIGLPDYPNYPVAQNVVLETGLSEGHLLTPSGMSKMIEIHGLKILDDHLDEEPAHGLHKGSPGIDLDNIENFPPAKESEALQGRRKDRYMTPGVSLAATQYQFNAKLQQHINDTGAHQLTKQQVLLGNYENYPVIGSDELGNFTATDRYLTPKTMYDFIKHHFWEEHLSHVYDENDPHDLKPVHVGLENVDNYSRDDYDGFYAFRGHSHGFGELPFTEQEYNDWQAGASFVLDSRIVTYEAGKVLWKRGVSPTTGKSTKPFPDNESNRVRQKNTVLRALNTSSNEYEEVEGTVALTATQDLTPDGARDTKWVVDNETFWLECQRLFPTPRYANHEVIADLYFTLELQEGMNGPEGIFFRPDGHYPWMRAQSTTAGDVGLGQYPNRGPDWYNNTFAASGHSHPGAGYAERSFLDANYERRNVYTSLAADIRKLVWSLTVQSKYMQHSVAQLSLSRYRRAPAFEDKDRNSVYIGTTWMVRKLGSNVIFGVTDGTMVTKNRQINDFPMIQANTGEWRVQAEHLIKMDNGMYRVHTGRKVVDTGDPKTNQDWVYSAYRDVLGRGDNPYWVQWDDPDAIGRPQDYSGPNYWMNVKAYTTEFDLRYDIAIVSATGPRDTPLQQMSGQRAEEWLDANAPDWRWGPWEPYESSIIFDNQISARAHAGKFNRGDFNIEGVEYRNAIEAVVDPAAEPKEWYVKAERRLHKY